MTRLGYARAFCVHLLTASGAGWAFGALIAAVRGAFELMFLCLGVALIIDALDGTFARRLKVTELLPRWSGEVLDLVVDFVTYVFVPAYAITAAGLLPPPLAVPGGILIVITGALYFADKRMKTEDHYFRGFPTLWNVVAFYLFVLRPAPWLAAAVLALLAVLTFVPFRFVHPFRVARLRRLTLAMLTLGSVLAAIALMRGLAPGPWVAGGLLAVAAYVIGVGLTAAR